VEMRKSRAPQGRDTFLPRTLLSETVDIVEDSL